MVCGNLGVSALAEGDFDGGIAYLLWAGKEDRAWAGDSTRSMFASDLYMQFAKGTNREGKSQFGRLAPWIMLKKAIRKYNSDCRTGNRVKIDDLFKELEASPEHRALLEGSLWVIHRNIVLLREENERQIYFKDNNVYTRLRLFDGIASLCRFIELRMRNYEKGIPPKTTLGPLLKDFIFKGQTWFKTDVSNKNTAPQTSADFDKLIENILKNEKIPHRSLLFLWAIRNYSAHICDPEAPSFFANFEEIFGDIIISYIFYLKFRNVLT